MSRVLLDATCLPPDRGGVGRYVDALVAALAGGVTDLMVACRPADRASFAETVGVHHVVVSPTFTDRTAARLAWEQAGLPALLRRLRPHVVHSPHYTMPLVVPAGTARVVTMHDATFFSHPELHVPVKGHFFRRWIRLSGRFADAIVVPSGATRDELRRVIPEAADRILVIHHGVDRERFRVPTDEQIQRARAWVGVPEDRGYIAFLGTLEPRKNVPALITAYLRACRDRPNPPVLVLAGGRGWDRDVAAAAANVPAPLQVRRTGFVPDDVLSGLLGGALVVAYPSLGEGFGLPVLEAMACGAPVLTTRELSLSEVAGDAAAYAASPHPDDIARALAELLDDPPRRAELSHRGLQHSRTFTWAEAARQHAELYDRFGRLR